MASRKSISKKVRFEIFKRDLFTCQYCGSTPPKAVLELDHIQPLSKKGSDNEDNLVTACFDCNRGKSNNLLDQVPAGIKDKAVILEEKELQLKEYNKLILKKKSRETREIYKIQLIFKKHFPDYSFNDTFKQSIRTNFLPYIHVSDLETAISMACTKKSDDVDSAIKYFCGICWRWRKEGVTYGW